MYVNYIGGATMGSIDGYSHLLWVYVHYVMLLLTVCLCAICGMASI